MKKISMLLSLIVALAMLVMPVGAMAEPTTAQVLQIANPTVYMDGEEVFTLDGLAAQFAVLEDSRVVQFIFDLFIGGENANSAMLQFDGESNIVGYLGGMSNAYTVNIYEALDMFAAALETESGISFEKVGELVEMAQNWTLIDDLMNVVNMHQNDFTTTDLGIMTGDSGIPMQYVQISGDMMPLIKDMAAVIDNDELLCAVVNLIDPSMNTLGLSAILAESNIALNTNITIGYDETGNIVEVKLNCTFIEGGEVFETIDCYMLMDSTDISNVKVSYNIKQTDMDGYSYMTQEGTMVLTDTGLTADVVETIYGEITNVNIVVDINGISDVVAINGISEEGDVKIAILYNGFATQTGYAFELVCEVYEYGYTDGFKVGGDFGITETSGLLNLYLAAYDDYGTDRIDLKLGYDNAAGVYSADLEVMDRYSDAPVSIGLSLTNIEPTSGAYYSGQLKASMNDGYTEIAANAYVHLLEVEVDTDSFYISPAAAINLLTMDDAQIEAAVAELETAVYDIGTMFQETYSHIFGE